MLIAALCLIVKQSHMNLKWTTQSLWFYIFSHTNCLVKPLHFTQMLYSHAIRPWIHSSSACIELNMLSIDLPVSREQTRGHVKVSVCVWEGEGDEKGPGRVSKSKEWERKERESSVCILDQWESERHCSSFRNTLIKSFSAFCCFYMCIYILMVLPLLRIIHLPSIGSIRPRSKSYQSDQEKTLQQQCDACPSALVWAEMPRTLSIEELPPVLPDNTKVFPKSVKRHLLSSVSRVSYQLDVP